MSTLHLVRHGRTEANASGLLLGRLDPPLDDVGRAQATAAADAIAGVSGIGRVICSPLARARDTASFIAARVGVGVEVDDRWVELDYGEYDGVALTDVPAAEWARWRADPTFTPPGGESLVALRQRVETALEGLRDELASGPDVVVVSHVSPIKAAVAWTLGVGDEVTWRMYLAPAAICRVRVDGRGPSLTGFNDVSHLAHLAALG
jgi:broad specificity phosphatase PhoE